MHKKKLIFQGTQPAKRITTQNLLNEFAELSDKDLQQIVGAAEPSSAPIGGGNKKQD